MELLPDEIIEHILTDSNLSISDVVNFSSTCYKFREMINSNGNLWRIKYFQRWPKTDVEIVCENWHKEYISRMHFEKEIQEMLSMMSSEFFHLDIKNIGGLQLNSIVHLINTYKYGYYYLKDFLIEINSLPLNQALTNKYYGNILMNCAHKRHCKIMWSNFLKLNVKEQTLEKGAIFVNFWCQKYERGLWNTIASELDNIANLARSYLFQRHKDHPLKNIPEETRLKWRNENIQESVFGAEHTKLIIGAINHVLFKVLRFCVGPHYYDVDRNCCTIDFALLDRKANPITFVVIYESVARRMGVRIKLIEFLHRCLLSWEDNCWLEEAPVHYVNSIAEDVVIEYVCPKEFNSNVLMTPCDMEQAAQNVALYVYPNLDEQDHLTVRDALELVLVVKPLSLECYQQLARTFMLHEMDARELIQNVKGVRSQISIEEWRWFQPLLHSLELYQQSWDRGHCADRNQIRTVQNRVEGIDFAVGMIVRDRMTDRTGVIHGWTLTEGTTGKFYQVPRKVLYNVLVDDGSYECLPQKNLQILHSPPLVSHPSIGRFFDEYCTTFYKPNRVLQAEYPQDMEALQEILKKDRRA